MQSSESSARRSKKESKTTAASNYKSTRVLQVAEPFPLPAAELESDSVHSIQRVLNPNFDTVSSALQSQCKIQKTTSESPSKLSQPLSPASPAKRNLSAPKKSHRSASSRRLVTQVEKRNQRERQRVYTVNRAFQVSFAINYRKHDFNDKFQALKSYLPSLATSTKRVSKLKILKSAINYIYGLHDQIDGIIDHIPSPISSNDSSIGSPNYIPSTTSPSISNIPLSTSIVVSQADIPQSDFQPNVSLFNAPVAPTLSSQQAANFFGLNYQDIASYVANLQN
ncbi:BHLH domain-containing protein [Aphelenchoides bicaudatus]|nr:BHLH domain-containing protein [Aphelenchoides bicaudatus]